MEETVFSGLYSTDDIWRGTNTTRCLTDDLDAMDAIHDSLPNTYAAKNHTHSGYAAKSHTHSYLPLSGGTLTGNVVTSKDINMGCGSGYTRQDRKWNFKECIRPRVCCW